ncbi:MAG TPA: hypothetical protein VFQ96_07820 [Microbacteriaceae bacterium]|nr:hypothetical protein [Microbacteriaceae bacterium]
MLATVVSAAAEQTFPMVAPIWVFGVLPLVVFAVLGLIMWSYHDVANRHSRKARAYAAGRSANGQQH